MHEPVRCSGGICGRCRRCIETEVMWLEGTELLVWDAAKHDPHRYRRMMKVYCSEFVKGWKRI